MIASKIDTKTRKEIEPQQKYRLGTIGDIKLLMDLMESIFKVRYMI